MQYYSRLCCGNDIGGDAGDDRIDTTNNVNGLQLVVDLLDNDDCIETRLDGT